MGFIERFIEKKENKWLWYLLTFIGSFLPLIVRFLVSGGFSSVNNFDIKDVLFAGIAMNLGNFNLLGGSKIEAKVVIAILSTILMLVIALIVGIFLAVESNVNDKNHFILLKSSSCVLVAISIFMSYTANNYALKNSPHA